MTIFQGIIISITKTESWSFSTHIQTDITNAKRFIPPNQAAFNICSNNEPISSDIVCSWNMT